MSASPIPDTGVWFVHLESVPGFTASITLPAPSDPSLSWVVLHMTAKIRVATAPSAPVTTLFSVLDNAVFPVIYRERLTVQNVFGDSDSLDVEGPFVASPGNSFFAGFDGATPGVGGAYYEDIYLLATLI